MFIPLSVPNLQGNEKKYVTDALESQWVSTSGSYVTLFEKNMSSYLNVKNMVACQSGTSAIHLSLILSNVTFCDEVIVPTLTFIAAVNPVKYLGAQPIFMDCDSSLNMDLDKLENFLEKECILISRGLLNKKTKKIIKALIVVHVFGNMANMERLMSLSEKYSFKVIEDATESLGTYCLDGKYKDKFAGTIGDFGAFSFNGNKIITTGGGGMIFCKDPQHLKKAAYLSSQAKDDELNYIHNEIGYNYRMTNIQAALGVSQLENLEQFIDYKINNYNLYKDNISNIPGLYILDFNKQCRSNYWFYSLYINKSIYGMDKNTLIVKLLNKKIQTRPLWSLIHTQKPYLKNQSYNIEKAYDYEKNLINIPCSTNLTQDEIIYIIDTLKNLGCDNYGSKFNNN